MKLRQLINRLEKLSHNGDRDHLEVCIRNAEDIDFPFTIKCAYIMQDPSYNFDTSNDGPYNWVQLEADQNLCDYGEE